MTKLTINKITYEVADRYKAGHVLTENEASTLNQTFRENIRNNWAGRFDQEGFDSSQEALDKYVADYEFGVRTGGGSRDPVETEAMNLAREKVKQLIRDAGKKLSDYNASVITAKAQELLDKYPVFRQKAAERIEEARRLAAQSGEEIGGDDMLASLTAMQAEADAKGETNGEGAADAGEAQTETETGKGRKKAVAA